MARHTEIASFEAAASDLALELAESGPARIEDELARFVRAARRYGVDPLLGSIVLDRGEPHVIRQRAFGTMHQQVARLIEDPLLADRARERRVLPDPIRRSDRGRRAPAVR